MAWFRNLRQLSPTTIPPPLKSTTPSFTFLLSHFSSQPMEVPPPGLSPTVPGQKPRVVVLGSGWGGCRLMKGLDTTIYDVVCVSPRNHMVFTPLLASTCVGTLEFRSVAEPIVRIQPAISREPGSYFFLANCTGVNPDVTKFYCHALQHASQLRMKPSHLLFTEHLNKRKQEGMKFDSFGK